MWFRDCMGFSALGLGFRFRAYLEVPGPRKYTPLQPSSWLRPSLSLRLAKLTALAVAISDWTCDESHSQDSASQHPVYPEPKEAALQTVNPNPYSQSL